MKTANINLYSFNELNDKAKEKAIFEHTEFLNSTPVECENEHGEMINEFFEHSEDETIESILINEYFFFENGKLADVTQYTGNHPKAGEIELNFYGSIYPVIELN